MKRYSFFILLSILLGGFLFSHPALAVADFFLPFSLEAISRGYTSEFSPSEPGAWGNFRLAVMPDLINEPINLSIRVISEAEKPPLPEGLKLVSDMFLFDILRENQASKEPLKFNRPLTLSLKYSSDTFFRKKIYFWDKINSHWTALPSSVDYQNKYVRAFSHLPYSIIAAFEDTRELEGKASWYRSSKFPRGVASNNYPLGTKLRVRNVDNGKVVDVEVVSTGPFSPERVIDLTLPAFQQIEESWKGLARVQVWPLTSEVKVLGLDIISQIPAPKFPEPKIASPAAISIKNEGNGTLSDIVYSKNYNKVLPIASLTKLMTAVVFLETGTPFDTVVTYQAGDNAIGSKLYISPGETILVKDLWYTMLVGSANNATNALVRASGLSQVEFVSRMNKKAKDLGLSATVFADPTGLEPTNVSTVYEAAKIARRAFADFKILQGTTTPVYSFMTINTGQAHTIKNTAKTIFDSKLNIIGMKTGYLDEAGYNFILKARWDRNSPAVISVILGAGSDRQRIDEANALTNYSLSRI